MNFKNNNLFINFDLYGENNLKEIIIIQDNFNYPSSFIPLASYLRNDFKTYLIYINSKKKYSIKKYAYFIKEFINNNCKKDPIIISHGNSCKVIVYLLGKLKVKTNDIIFINPYIFNNFSKTLFLFKKYIQFKINGNKEIKINYNLRSLFVRNKNYNITKKIFDNNVKRYIKNINNLILTISSKKDLDIDSELIQDIIDTTMSISYKEYDYYPHLNMLDECYVVIKNFLE